MDDKPKVIEFRSEHSATVLYACGYCGYTKLTREYAEACCICKGCGANTDARHDECEPCRTKRFAEQQAAFYARDMALPVVEDKGEPVFAGERFYETADAASEAIWDDGGDPTKVIAYPCTVGTADTPLIQELIEEHWYCQFEDPDMIEMSKELAAACAEFQKLLEAEAPIMWSARTKERVALDPIDESKVVHLNG